MIGLVVLPAVSIARHDGNANANDRHEAFERRQSRRASPHIEPNSTPVGVQGPEGHSVDQAATAALKSLVRSTLKAPPYVDAEKLSDSARSTAFKRSLPAVRAHLLP